MTNATPKTSELERRSAEGAKYVSQGQALSGAKRVAPGKNKHADQALKERNTVGKRSRGDALRSAQCLPLAAIFRAFGA